MAAALNDSSRARIGSHRRNTWAVSIASTDVDELVELGASLETLGIVYQTNFRRNTDGTPEEGFVSIYRYEDQQRLWDVTKGYLRDDVERQLSELVVVRGPIPSDDLERMVNTIRFGRGYQYLADRLNEHGVIAGMRGPRWTPKKLKAALRGAA